MNICPLLFFEFFKIGLFSFGGGYATLPFLYHIAESYKWFSLEELGQMIAISSITPGPIGLNMATFAGFKTFGFLGAIISSLALCLPSLFLVLGVCKILKMCQNNFYINSILYGLRPAGCAMLMAVGCKLFLKIIFNFNATLNKIIDIKALLLLIILIIWGKNNKKNVVFYLLTGAFLGIVFNLYKFL